jgi:hypothetical protein
MKHTAKDMLTLLEQHYAPPPSKPAGGRLITELQAPIGLRRADALYLPTTTSGRGTIIGHEIKVSRADVIAEIRDPHKADAWMRYCNRWWLVVSDPALIDGLDIPHEWGVMAPPTRNRFMTIVTKAPLLTPDPSHLGEAWGTIFARVGYSDIASQTELQYQRTRAEKLEEANREHRREIARLTAALGEDKGASRINRITVADVLDQIDRLGEYGPDGVAALRGAAWSVDAEKVARGILAEVTVAEKRNDLSEHVADMVERANGVAERLAQVLEEIR